MNGYAFQNSVWTSCTEHEIPTYFLLYAAFYPKTQRATFQSEIHRLKRIDRREDKE